MARLKAVAWTIVASYSQNATFGGERRNPLSLLWKIDFGLIGCRAKFAQSAGF